jgi:hypothetical protein
MAVAIFNPYWSLSKPSSITFFTRAGKPGMFCRILNALASSG